MTDQGFTVFETAIGACAIAWNARGIMGVSLPERQADETRARMARRFPEAAEQAAPAAVQAIIDDIVALLAGEARDLSAVGLDLSAVPDFNRRVYEVARTIPPGRTLTYGEIAARLGVPKEAREVGQALGRNPCPIIVPCHRVLAASGKSGGFSARGGVTTKLRMLSIERAHAKNDAKDALTLFDGDAAFGFQAPPRRPIPKSQTRR